MLRMVVKISHREGPRKSLRGRFTKRSSTPPDQGIPILIDRNKAYRQQPYWPETPARAVYVIWRDEDIS